MLIGSDYMPEYELEFCVEFLFGMRRDRRWSLDGVHQTQDQMWERVRKWETRGMQFDIPSGEHHGWDQAYPENV